MRFIVSMISLLNVNCESCDDWWLVELGSLHIDLLAFASAIVVITKNGYSANYFRSLTLTLSLRAERERNLTLLVLKGQFFAQFFWGISSPREVKRKILREVRLMPTNHQSASLHCLIF